jgi:hypothetical protein
MVMRMNERARHTRLALRRQRDVLCDVMLGAAECGTWLTLKELSTMTRYGEASISAQLRHLRKPQYGGFVVEKQRRGDQEAGRGAEQGTLWEYRLQRRVRLGGSNEAMSAPAAIAGKASTPALAMGAA